MPLRLRSLITWVMAVATPQPRFGQLGVVTNAIERGSSLPPDVWFAYHIGLFWNREGGII